MTRSTVRTTSTISARVFLLSSAIVLALGPAAPMWAATFIVSSTTDAVDATPGNGVCATAAGECTLRAAVQEANALAGEDTINVPSGTFILTRQGVSENAAATGDLDVAGALTITGTGATPATISGGGIDRVFDILAQATVTLSRLIVQNGNAGGPGAFGGGIQNAGNLTLLNVAIKNNTAQQGDGGGIANLGSGRMELTNVTLSANVALMRGGGIANDVGGVLQLVNVTLNDNGAFQGGNIDNLGEAQLVNTIAVKSREGSNCTGAALLTLGYNIDDGESCGFTAPGDLPDTDPALGTLQAGFVYPLITGSPAIDAGDNGHCPDTDQRGAPRPTDGNADGQFRCDIGAYEAPGPVPFTPTPSPTPTATTDLPTATPTDTPNPPTLTPTPVLPTATPGGAAIRLSSATGSPGDQVTFSATLETGGNSIGSTQNDIAFDSENTPIARLLSGVPDCTLNPELTDKSHLFVFRPTGCSATACTMVRTTVFSFPPISPIADGSTLYTCTVSISADAQPGDYALGVSLVKLSNPLATPVAGVGIDGKVVVVPPATLTPTATASDTPTPTATPLPCVGDCDHNGQVEIAEVIIMVNIALGTSPPSACIPGDANGDGVITVNEIVAAVNNSLSGCPGSATTR